MKRKKVIYAFAASILAGSMLVAFTPDKKEITIHAIENLNKGSAEENSHEGETANSRLELNRRQYIALDKTQLGISKAMYPRFKQFKDGSYILIYQDGQIGWNIYYITSKDLVTWTKPAKLFSSYKILNGADDRAFSTADAVVLQNGDILAVSSFRANKGYSTKAGLGGLMMRRSSDGGATWSEEEVIYTGANWEPSLTQLPSGEIQVYFTHPAPKMELENTLHSGSTAIIRSYDNGETWTPNVTEPPYEAHRIAQQYVKTTSQGVLSFTDQMPSAIMLQGGKGIALAMESHLADDSYMISLAYSSDNWAKGLAMNESGPADRQSNKYKGAAPYLAQFPSGETVLAYNESAKYKLRIGDADARNFGDEYFPYTGGGYWGSTELIGSHTLVAAYPKVISTGGTNYNNSIMLGKLYLNHRIDAKKMKKLPPGNGKRKADEWNGNTDALFVGSASQAQASIRAGHDKNNLYVLVERLDKFLTNEDTVSLSISSGEDKESFYRVELDSTGLKQVSRFINGGYQQVATSEVQAFATIQGTVDDNSDEDIGYKIETAIPFSLIGSGEKTFRVNVSLVNKDGGAALTDTVSGVSASDQNTWFSIQLVD